MRKNRSYLKTCSKCGRELPSFTYYFHQSRPSTDGLRNPCKECSGKEFGWPKNTIIGSKKRCRGCSKFIDVDDFYRLANGSPVSVCKTCSSEWSKTHRDYINDYYAKDRAKNPQAYRDRANKHAWKDRETYLKRVRKYKKEKRQTDDHFRIKDSLSSRLNGSVKGEYRSKSASILLGCTIEELKEYIKKKFTEYMTWDNYGRGGWELDHIKPCVMFDLTDTKQQQECFHYTNLQPMWSRDNKRKSATYNGEFHGKQKRHT